MDEVSPLYPAARVRLRSRNPIALVSAVRLALRRAGADHDEIDRFTEEALGAADPAEIRRSCRRWVLLDA
jgi:hypothetical protein